jgi:hypothetical protein
MLVIVKPGALVITMDSAGVTVVVVIFSMDKEVTKPLTQTSMATTMISIDQQSNNQLGITSGDKSGGVLANCVILISGNY